jgi:hypothetical protein
LKGKICRKFRSSGRLIFEIHNSRFINSNQILLDNILINPILAAPTAAGVSLGGQVSTASGRGIWRATVVLTGGSLEAPVYAVTDYEGNYNFYDIPAGETYVLSVFVKGYKFNQTSIVVNLDDDFTEAHFTGTPKQKIGTVK